MVAYCCCLICCNRTKDEGDDNYCRHFLHCNITKKGDNNLLLSPFSLQHKQKEKGDINKLLSPSSL